MEFARLRLESEALWRPRDAFDHGGTEVTEKIMRVGSLCLRASVVKLRIP